MMTETTGAIKHLPLRLGITRVDVRLRFALAIVVEGIYMVLSRYAYHGDGVSYADVEILRTPLRLGAALLLWLLMADVIFGERQLGQPLPKGSLLQGLGLLFIAPLFAGGYDVPAYDAAITAAASFPVALHEEFFYRGILQAMLVKYLGGPLGIGIATACFTLFHVGVSEPTILNFALIALAGLIFGLLYFRTGSMTAVILVHAIDDALPCVNWGKFFWPEIGLVFLLGSVLLLALSRRSDDVSPSAR